MTNLPDWLVERAALDEVAPVSRPRVDTADPRELAERIAALRADNASELAAHPTAAAVAQIESRVAAARRRRRRTQRRWFGVMSVAIAGCLLVVIVGPRRVPGTHQDDEEVTRVKGSSRLIAYRQSGERTERLDKDSLVRAGDVVQLAYNGGGHKFGVIASVDGAGVVTLHFPASEDAPPEGTALLAKTTALPHAYVLDDAPRFERFFLITADQPIDVQQSLASLRALARRSDADTAPLEVTAGLQQWSLRLRKPDRQPSP